MKISCSIRKLLAVASLSIMPFLAYAHPLLIVNNTETPISFTVNDKCSNEIGTVKVVGIKNISEDVLNKLCLNYTQPCTITAHNGSQCLGKTVGGMTYNSEHNFTVNGEPNSDVSVTATEDRIIFSTPIRRK